MLALSFLLLIGVTLIAEGFDQHISKGYIYFAMAFSVFVEMLNLRMRRHEVKPVELRSPYAGSIPQKVGNRKGRRHEGGADQEIHQWRGHRGLEA